MSQRQLYTTRRLIVRSLLPSAGSFFACLFVAIAMVVINIVLRSVDVGVTLPGIFDGQWAIAYSQHVVQPLTELLHSNTLNKGLIAVLWGVAGFIVYIGFEYAAHTYNELKQSKQDIRMARGGRIEQSPLVQSFWRGMAWRTGVIVGGIIFFALVTVPLLGNALGIAQSVILSQNLQRDGLRLLLAIGEWMVCLHGLVVFLRLYTMRTRLFGDDIMY